MKVKLDWSSVENNSSSVDALLEFARGASLRATRKLVWDRDVSRLLGRLARLPASIARQRARGWAQRNKYDL